MKMAQHLLSVFLLLCGNAVLESAVASQTTTDLRVLIDVSGSMKQNDPKNLRTPAVRLLVGMIPKGTHAGIWNFAKYASMEVPAGNVDDQWKNKGRKAASKIHSRGLYTNIELALNKATVGWESPDANQNRHIILLTDGMVDVSKDAQLDQESKDNVIKTLLPKFKNLGIHIHTIALSEHADHNLLKTLSGTTDGWYERIDQAEHLQKSFLRLFETTVQPDTVPLDDNRFKIDASISDITLLVFNDEDDKPSQLKTPDGKLWEFDKHPDNVNWEHDQGFDMISIKNPMPGDWKIIGKRDPDNRVTVVTNLRLNVSELPNNILLGDQVPILAHLQQSNQIITDKRFLALSRIYIRQQSGDKAPIFWPMNDHGKDPDKKAADGIFSMNLNRTLEPDVFELAIVAYSATFNREHHHTLRIHETPVRLSTVTSDAGDSIQLRLALEPGMLVADSIIAKIDLSNAGQMPLPRIDDLNWAMDLAPEYSGQQIKVLVTASRSNGKEYEIELFKQLPTLEIGTTGSLQGNSVGSATSDTMPATEKSTSTPKKSDHVEVEDSTSKTEDSSFPIFIVTLVLGHLLLIAAGYFAYRYFKRQKLEDSAQHDALLNTVDLEDDDELEEQNTIKAEATSDDVLTDSASSDEIIQLDDSELESEESMSSDAKVGSG